MWNNNNQAKCKYLKKVKYCTWVNALHYVPSQVIWMHVNIFSLVLLKTKILIISCLPLLFWTLGGSRSPNRAEWVERACQWWKLPCSISNNMYSSSVRVVLWPSHHIINLVWGLYLCLRRLLRKISSFPSFYQKMSNIPAIVFPRLLGPNVDISEIVVDHIVWRIGAHFWCLLPVMDGISIQMSLLNISENTP